MIGRALDLAFRTEQFGALDLIAKDLDENSDPRVLERAAQFFSNNQQDRTAFMLRQEIFGSCRALPGQKCYHHRRDCRSADATQRYCA